MYAALRIASHIDYWLVYVIFRQQIYEKYLGSAPSPNYITLVLLQISHQLKVLFHRFQNLLACGGLDLLSKSLVINKNCRQ